MFEMKDAKSLIKRYKQRANLVKALTVAAVLIMFLLPIPITGKILSAIGLFAAEVIVLSLLMTHTANSALTRDLDPELYYAVSHGIGAAKDNSVDITAAYYMQDYHAAYNMCIRQITSSRSVMKQYWCKMMLARIYFDTDELEGLRGICEDFCDAFNGNRKLFSQYGQLMGFYSLYCDGSYAACCEMYKKRMEEDMYKKIPLVRTQIDYAYAMACYRNGDQQEARAYFDHVAENAPKLNFSFISRKYLDAMASGCAVIVERKYEVEEEFTPPTVSRKKLPVSKWIVLSIIAFLAAFVIVGSLYQSRPQEPLAALQSYDEAAEELYSMITLNEQGDALAVYRYGENDFGIAYMDGKDDGRYTCKMTLCGIVPGWRYVVQAPDSDLRLTCALFEKAYEVPATAVSTVTFSTNEKDCVLAVLTCESHKSWTYAAYVEDPEQVKDDIAEYFENNT